jgi:PHD/YefM family antitoxin component YafN of YafNO toxin-antitoxin module
LPKPPLRGTSGTGKSLSFVTILITQHGLPSAYLLDVETYELMEQRMAILEGIARGERAIAEGRVASHAQAKKRLARWLK